MERPAIKVEGVSKRYRLGAGVGFDRRISESVDAAMRAPFRRLLGRGSSDSEGKPRDFWALRDVNLEVPKGQVLGLIGANGAGKSTLLKLLARITLPTEGRITLRGKVGSLLEVGTGFHPELTGRENVYLNGSILGMRRHEIAARYDEIVEFAGIQDFMETPVKRYSSGMFVRLAFAVAAHLEPDILLMDEVLAVGDAAFQRKSLRKMESIAHSEGRTIVYVSHGMTSIKKLCDRVAVIEDGRVVADGPADKMIADYMHRVEPVAHGGFSVVEEDADRIGTGEVRIRSVSLFDDNDEQVDELLFGQPFTVSMEAEVAQTVSGTTFMVGISSAEGTRILSASNTDRGGIDYDLTAGQRVEVRARIDADLLPTEFMVDAWVIDMSGQTIDFVERVISFTVKNVAADGSRDTYMLETVVGYVRPDTQWELSEKAGREWEERVAPS